MLSSWLYLQMIKILHKAWVTSQLSALTTCLHEWNVPIDFNPWSALQD